MSFIEYQTKTQHRHNIWRELHCIFHINLIVRGKIRKLVTKTLALQTYQQPIEGRKKRITIYVQFDIFQTNTFIMEVINIFGDFLIACEEDNLDYVRERIAEMFPKYINNVIDEHDFGPIHYAVKGNSIECVRLLLTVDSIDPQMKTDEGYTPLMLAVQNDCSIEIIRLLVEFDPLVIDMPTYEGVYPLHLAISQCHSLEMVKTMIEAMKRKGLMLTDHIDVNGDSCILLAARMRLFEILDYLLENTPFSVIRTNGTERRGALLEMMLHWRRSRSSPRSEIFYNCFGKLFLKTHGDIDNALLEMWILIDDGKFYEMHDWLIQNTYLIESNEYREIVEKTYDFIIKNMTSKKRRHECILLLPLHSHLKIENFSEERQISLWKDIQKYSIEVFQIDRPLFHQWSAIVNVKFPCPSSELLVQTFNELIYVYSGSTLVEFMEITNTFKSVRYNECMSGFCELVKKSDLTIEKTLPRFLVVFMPLTSMAYADSLIDDWSDFKALVTGPENARPRRLTKNSLRKLIVETENIRRFFSQRFHKDPMPLTMLCRIVIRKAVYEPVRYGKMDSTKSKPLMSLPVPNTVKDFLRYNYTNCNLSKQYVRSQSKTNMSC